MRSSAAILALIFLTLSAFGQGHRPGGFSDVPWGTNYDKARRTMLGKPGTEIDARDSTASRLGLKGGTFAGRPALVWGLEFVDAGFYRGAVILKAFANRAKEFEDVKAMLVERYGQPSSVSKKGRDSKAIWKFPPDSRNSHTEVIILWNNPSEAGVKVTYRNESMKEGVVPEEL